MAQWFSSFYWHDYPPILYSESQKHKILESSGGTCVLPNCNSKLEMKDGQFLHLKQYVHYDPPEGHGLLICPKCFDDMRDREKSDRIMLNE